MSLYREKRGKWNMKKTGIVICVLAALVGLAGCSSVVSSDKTDYRKINDKNGCTIIVSISTQHNKIIRFLELCKSKNFFIFISSFLNVTIFLHTVI